MTPVTSPAANSPNSRRSIRKPVYDQHHRHIRLNEELTPVAGEGEGPSLSLRLESDTRPLLDLEHHGLEEVPEGEPPTIPTAATVVALDDCTMAVTDAPVSAPVHGLRVKRASARSLSASGRRTLPAWVRGKPSKKKGGLLSMFGRKDLLDAEVVVIPDEPGTLKGLDDSLSRLNDWGVRHRVDPILEPIGFGRV